jgi:hypothetical protein
MDKNKKKGDIVLSKKEQEQIKNMRDAEKKRQDCINEIQDVLIKYSSEIRVNPNSPLGNPSVMIVLKD